MSSDPPSKPVTSNPFQSKAKPLGSASGVLRLATMIMSGGALVLPVTWMVVRLRVPGMLAWMAPVLVAWLLAALPVSLTFLRAAGNPWMNGGKAWMAACALLQVVVLALWAIAVDPAGSDASMMRMFTGLGILAISIPFGLVGWIRYALRASRKR